MFKVNKNTRNDKSDISVFIVHFEDIFFTFFSGVSIIDFEQVNVSWVLDDFRIALIKSEI